MYTYGGLASWPFSVVACPYLGSKPKGKGDRGYDERFHVRALPSFQQPSFQAVTNINVFSAAWSAFHLNITIIMLVPSDTLKCRLLK